MRQLRKKASVERARGVSRPLGMGKKIRFMKLPREGWIRLGGRNQECGGGIEARNVQHQMLHRERG